MILSELEWPFHGSALCTFFAVAELLVCVLCMSLIFIVGMWLWITCSDITKVSNYGHQVNGAIL